MRIELEAMRTRQETMETGQEMEDRTGRPREEAMRIELVAVRTRQETLTTN